MKKKNNLSTKEYKIIDKKELAPDTFLFRLSGRLDFEPGQFVQVVLPHFGEATFAPCSDPENKNYFELCIRACGSTTNQLVNLLPGDSMEIRGPYGNFWPTSKFIGKNLVIIAGGLGVIPIRPLLYSLIKYRSDFKNIALIYGAKSDHQLLFNDDFKSWKKNLSNVDFIVEHRSSDFDGKVGLITKPLQEITINPKNTTALICGPEIMFQFCNEILLEKGLSEKDIYISFERRMECGIGICQHCNIGKYKVCEDGPVFSLEKIKSELGK